MNTKIERLNRTLERITEIIDAANELEVQYAQELSEVHPLYQLSAKNFIHYLALRSSDIGLLQENLRNLGLPGVENIEINVLRSLDQIRFLICKVLDTNHNIEKHRYLSLKKSRKLLNRNTRALLGYKSSTRRAGIMVTMPNSAAEDHKFIARLIRLGMNNARINCAHDDSDTWLKIIAGILHYNDARDKRCRITMDLAGPKLRTGEIASGPGVIHIKPVQNNLGQMVAPARVFITPETTNTPEDPNIAVIPVSEEFALKIKRGDRITFNDSRGKKCTVRVVKKKGAGRWGICYDSAFLTTGTVLVLHKMNKNGKEKDLVGELVPLHQSIILKNGDYLILHTAPKPGEPSQYSQDGTLISHAHISCTLPEAFQYLREGQPVFFDDGKIEGVIAEAYDHEVKIKITHAKISGSKLGPDKGINLPDSNLDIPGLTGKDIKDLEFIAAQADIISLSFVKNAKDIMEFIAKLEKFQDKPGIILKIETKQAFANLPEIILTAMRYYPAGIMIARGDLAIETGWKDIASIQQEILRMSEAAHLPDIWATQVLDNLIRKGTPTRAEITDAWMAQQAECIMLNKGLYIERGMKMLNRMSRAMQRNQGKNAIIMPRLVYEGKLRLPDLECNPAG